MCHNPCFPDCCPGGGIGRRSGLKIRRGQPLASSSLAPGTKKIKGLQKCRPFFIVFSALSCTKSTGDINSAALDCPPGVCTIVNNTASNPLTPYTVFEDVLNPVGFRVFVLDKNGNRAAATISWMVQGIYSRWYGRHNRISRSY